jgi:membrane-bound serine protease (ClpP class)
VILRRPAHLIVAAFICLCGLWAVPAGQAQDGGIAYSIELDADISPATEAWIGTALDDAADAGAELAIIRLDTPGGLDDSTREIVKDITAAPMPVVVYVSPDGARAGSAGAYITQAADVAAMAPQTNIGSATPISIGPGSDDEVLGRKITNDAAAYMRTLADAHDRNPDLGEQMVTDAVNVTAQEALDADFIDVIAESEEELLADLDGFRVAGPKAQTLQTAGLEIESHDMPLRYELLAIVVDPTIAFLLLTVGMIGLAIELFSPGLILPGALGAVSLILGLFGTSQLPVTAAGVALLILAIGLIIAEAQLPTGGFLGVAGVIALVFAGLLLFNEDEGADVSVPVIITSAILLGGFAAFLVDRVVKARREPVRTGQEEMIGIVAEARSRLDPEGQVWAEGALWRARLAEGEDTEPVPAGAHVRVVAVEGLTLVAVPAAAPTAGAAEVGDRDTLSS